MEDTCPNEGQIRRLLEPGDSVHCYLTIGFVNLF